ncbi:MAG: MarR family transcriptional regulator [Boseongicola sp. SB0664_bin_43]|uniref:MarR family transcriptional regulator n=1 Tax=Boseongicola sp. SB0664_bin_43 TaxID=2604844 RepID=A0A6B0XY59_9RHOB|nr:MarR family transcriptional regulator [Boseongicola sp. SB0664_bin_43]
MQETAKEAVPARRKPVHADDMDITELSSYRLSRHNRLMRRGRDAEAERLRVSVDEWRLLFVLNRGGSQPSIRIAEAALMDRGTVSRSVARLESRGLVYRLSDATDRRVAVVNLTEAGAVVADQVAAFMLGRELEMIGELTEEEWQAWLSITDKFHRFLAAKYGEDG